MENQKKEPKTFNEIEQDKEPRRIYRFENLSLDDLKEYIKLVEHALSIDPPIWLI